MLSQTNQIGSEVGSGRRRIGLQAHGLLKMRIGLGVLGLRGVDQSQEFVNFEALRNLAQQCLPGGCGFCKMSGIVLGDGRLELAV